MLPLASKLFNGNYYAYLKEWEKHDNLNETEHLNLQQNKLHKILKYAIENVPYYKSMEHLDYKNINSFPILTKDVLRKNCEELISKEYDINNLDKNNSSGSSGFQSFTYMSKDHKSYLRALQTHWWQWGGFRPGKKTLQTGISPKRGFTKKLKDTFFRINYLEAFKLNENKIDQNLKEFVGKKNIHLAGYPSALNQIAVQALQKNKNISFSSVITFGDKLFDHYRQNFNKAFNNPTIINTYGCAEGLLMACQVDLPFYYIMSPHVYLEIVDGNGNNVEDGKMGHILITCLTNSAMPLLRYKLGDLGIKLSKENYPQKRRFNYPLLEEVIGRETDVIKTPLGSILTVHSFTGVIEYLEYIKQYKIIQISKSELEIEYTTENHKPLSDRQKDELISKLKELTDFSMRIILKRRNEISPSPSGKPQIIEIKYTKD